nr:hypothetical protein [Vibrio ostreicida]
MKTSILPIVVGLFSFTSNACPLYDDSQSSDSVMFSSQMGLCISWLDGIKYTSDKLDDVNTWFIDDVETDYTAYWSDWFLQTETSPILSQNLASNYIGLGIWIPSELEDKVSLNDTDEWLMSHGLQLSLGFGDKKSGEPRLRLDYRWHDDAERNVMMQLELPF